MNICDFSIPLLIILSLMVFICDLLITYILKPYFNYI